MENICKAGIPIVTTQGANGGISFMEGFSFDCRVIVFTKTHGNYFCFVVSFSFLLSFCKMFDILLLLILFLFAILFFPKKDTGFGVHPTS